MLKSKLQRFALAGAGLVSAIGLGAASFAHAQAFEVSTSTQNTDIGTMLQLVYDRLISVLNTGGVIEFVVVMTILAGVIALLIWGLHKLFGGRRVR